MNVANTEIGVRTLLIMKFIRCIQIGHDYYGESRELAKPRSRYLSGHHWPGGRLLMLALALSRWRSRLR